MTNFTRPPRSGVRLGRATVALVALLLLAVALAAPAAALAYDGPVDTAAGRTVQGAEHGDSAGNPEANLPFLFAVFIVTWAMFFAYVAYMARKQRSMQQEIEILRASVLGEGQGSEEESNGTA